MGSLIFRRCADGDFVERLRLAALPTLLLAFLLHIAIGVTTRPFSDWDTVRLTPVLALWHGYPLYPTLNEGPAISFCYGPVSALVYLPVVTLQSPTSVVIAGALLTVILILAPVLWVHLDRRIVGADSSTDGVMGFMAFCGLAFMSPALSYSLYSPAHDGVALSLGAIATGVLCRRPAHGGATPLKSLMISACVAVLCVWAKQTMVPILLALPVFVLLADSARNCLRYVLLLALFGTGISLLFLTTFGSEGLILNMFELPRQHPRQMGLLESLSAFLPAFSVFGVVLLFVLLVFAQSDQLPGGLAGYRQSNAVRGFLAFIIVGVSELPAGIIGYTKLGGYVNSFSLPLYYCGIATTLVLSGFSRAPVTGPHSPVKRRIAQALLVSIAFVHVLLPGWLGDLQADFRHNPLEAAFEYEKKYPGKAYFPWNTLSVLMAGGKAYHAEDGLISLRMAGMKLPSPQSRAFLPADANLVALPPNYPTNWTKGLVLEYLSDYRRRVAVDELPGWTVFEREPR